MSKQFGVTCDKEVERATSALQDCFQDTDWNMFKEAAMKVILRHKDLHAYGKICESVHKTASANKICKRKRSFAKV